MPDPILKYWGICASLPTLTQWIEWMSNRDTDFLPICKGHLLREREWVRDRARVRDACCVCTFPASPEWNFASEWVRERARVRDACCVCTSPASPEWNFETFLLTFMLLWIWVPPCVGLYCIMCFHITRKTHVYLHMYAISLNFLLKARNSI